MPRQAVSSLGHGDSVDEVFLLADKQLRANRNGDLYLLTQLRDCTGQVSGLMWNVAEDRVAELSAGGYAHVKGKAQLYNGQMQVIVTRIDAVEESTIDRADFIPGNSGDTAADLARVKELVGNIASRQLRSLLECYLDDAEFVEKLLGAPAGIRLHHAQPGGLLQHLRSLMELALAVAPFYPAVDDDLLIAGAFLHDLSKVDELEYDATFGYSDEGQLIGHLVMGVELLAKKVAECEARLGETLDEELVLRLKHMIVSHHGVYEHGSPKLPMTPEAVALWLLDNLDAKLNEFSDLIQNDPNSDSAWTPFNQHLQRKLYKGGSGQAPSV